MSAADGWCGEPCKGRDPKGELPQPEVEPLGDIDIDRIAAETAGEWGAT